MADVTDVPATSKRREVSKRSFLQAEGEPTKRATSKSTGFRIEFVGSDQKIEHQLSDFDEGVRNAAAAFGFVTAITNAFGGNKGPVEDIIEVAMDRVQAFLEGDWTSEAESGPRSSQILEAAVAVRQDAGIESTQEWKDKFLATIKADEAVLKDLNKDPIFAAKLAAIKAEAATKRAAAAAEKAKAAGGKSILLG